MDNMDFNGVVEFPLSERAARKILKKLASEHTDRIRWSIHIKRRMLQRGVTSRQILLLLKNRHLIFKEGPYLAANGDWKFNIIGGVSGDVLELVIALRNPNSSPKAMLITVWIL
jgi:hypothetical protein